MRFLKKILLGSALFAITNCVFAAPANLTTTNNSNHGKVYAKIGAYKSPEPVSAHQERNREWNSVKFLCTIQRMPEQCTAEILVEHDITGQLESLGNMTIDLNTGELTPGSLSSAHYIMNVVGNAHVEVNSINEDY